MFRTPSLSVTLLAAACVALAGCSGGGGGTESEEAATDTGPLDHTVELLGTDSLEYRPSQVRALPGAIQVELTCGESVNHNVVVEGVDGEQAVVECDPGGAASGTVTLETGDYTFYCSIPGHRSQGMEGQLTVVPSGQG